MCLLFIVYYNKIDLTTIQSLIFLQIEYKFTGHTRGYYYILQHFVVVGMVIFLNTILRKDKFNET